MAALEMLDRRLAHGTEPAAANVDLSVYDTFTRPRIIRIWCWSSVPKVMG